MSARRIYGARLTWKFADGTEITTREDVAVLTFDERQTVEERDEAMRFAASSLLKDKIEELKKR